MTKCTVLAMAMTLSTGTAEAQGCLHGPDETVAERMRRQAAIAFVEQITSAQTRLHRERGTYVALRDATAAASVPLGFVPRLMFDRWSYAVTVKDTFDPCRFALFSDQDGIVYEARPIARVDDEPRQEPGGAASTLTDDRRQVSQRPKGRQ